MLIKWKQLITSKENVNEQTKVFLFFRYENVKFMKNECKSNLFAASRQKVFSNYGGSSKWCPKFARLCLKILMSVLKEKWLFIIHYWELLFFKEMLSIEELEYSVKCQNQAK